MLLKVVNNGKTTEEICAAAAEFGTLMPVSNFESDKGYSVVMLYYLESYRKYGRSHPPPASNSALNYDLVLDDRKNQNSEQKMELCVD